MPSMISSGPASAAPMGSGGRGGPSAQVLEFICLFTHDLRRKQKRWEDGRLKYHTFNKRVMVYDERGNFVGDMHWQRDWSFDEGEEVQLERGGVIVQVMECVGRQAQDLSELLEKRAKEKEQRQARVAMRPTLSAASPHLPVSGARVHDHFQTRHQPLNHVLGTPTGHHGRAVVPSESPFELRQMADENPDDRTESRPAKRRRCDITPPTKKGYAQALFGATLSLSSAPASSAPQRQPVRPAHRPQPESSPQEEPMPNGVSLLREGRDISARINSHAGSLRANLVVPVAELEDEEPPEPAPVILARQRPEKPFIRPRVSIQQTSPITLRPHSTMATLQRLSLDLRPPPQGLREGRPCETQSSLRRRKEDRPKTMPKRPLSQNPGSRHHRRLSSMKMMPPAPARRKAILVKGRNMSAQSEALPNRQNKNRRSAITYDSWKLSLRPRNCRLRQHELKMLRKRPWKNERNCGLSLARSAVSCYCLKRKAGPNN